MKRRVWDRSLNSVTGRWALARYLYKPNPRSRAQRYTCDLRAFTAAGATRARAHGRHHSPFQPSSPGPGGTPASMAATATIAAHLPLRGPARPPSRPSVAAVTRFRGRQERRGLAATGGRGFARVRAEAFSGGGGVGRRDPMVPPYNVLITGSTKGERAARCWRIFV